MHLRELKTHYSEARLVQLLEEKGIGRPSTFSSLIDKIQERNYVKKENVTGKMLTCLDFELAEGKITSNKQEREFGNEMNKLVIQPLGILALEFLLTYFETFFAYTYTKEMEDALDKISQDQMGWTELCRSCNNNLDNLSTHILEKGKETIRIDDTHTYVIGKYGPVIKCTAPDKTESNKEINKESKNKSNSKKVKPKPQEKGKEIIFKPVRKDIDLNKLRRGEYKIEDIVEPAKPADAAAPSLGLYKDEPVYVKEGKFGIYLEWGTVSKSLKQLKKKVEEIEMEDIIELLEAGESSILREIGPDASLRKGKGAYGDYILYKNKKMKKQKPRFLKLTGFTEDYLTCDLSILQKWFKETYKIDP
jgi:DNA topoisomerase-1